jgi:CheY-like chemotaxis protein
MPGIDGCELYEKAIELRPELRGRAVLMSGDVLNPDLRTFAEEHDLRLLAKPFDLSAVVQLVDEVLTEANAADGE